MSSENKREIVFITLSLIVIVDLEKYGSKYLFCTYDCDIVYGLMVRAITKMIWRIKRMASFIKYHRTSTRQSCKLPFTYQYNDGQGSLSLSHYLSIYLL